MLRTEDKRAIQKAWRQTNSAHLQAYNAQWVRDNPVRMRVLRRRALLKAKYNMTIEDYAALLLRQGGHCALCERTTNLHIDHDHKSGTVRGILCIKHNHAFGVFGDNVEGLVRALAYLEKVK